MTPARLAVRLLPALLAVGCAAVPGPVASATSTASEQWRTGLMVHSLFVVVVPVPKDPGIQYAQPLPVDQLPFRERTANASIRGTAFAIGSNRFVTTADVLPSSSASGPRIFLADAEKRTTEIVRIVKYSQFRDLVEFEVKEPPPGVVPLELAPEQIRIGDPLTAVGHWDGNELVLLGSAVTEFTPEELAGAWQVIHFSAPAALGTGGGPILDRAGRVVGVVTKIGSPVGAANEATPIGELAKVSDSASEFWTKGNVYREDNRQIFSDWKFASPLPAAPAELWAAVARSRLALRESLITNFDVLHARDVYPRPANLQAFLRHPSVPFGFGVFAMDGNGRWSLAHETYIKKEISPGQFANYAQRQGHAELVIDRPPGVSLAQFFQSPKALGQTVLKLLGMKRSFAGQSIAVTSLGEPAERERWVDALGRPWFTSVWRLAFVGNAIVLSCLTNPGGLACQWQVVPLDLEEIYRTDLKRNARRTTFVYYGRLEDWSEFLALPAAFKPEALSRPGTIVRFDGGLTVDLAGFRGRVGTEASGLSDASVLTLFLMPDGTTSFGPRAFDLRLRPRSDKRTRFDVEQIFAPLAGSPQGDVQIWRKLQTTEPPYNGVAMFDGKENIVRLVRKPRHPTNPDVRYVYYCRAGPEDDKAELQKDCAQMVKTIALSGDSVGHGDR